MKLDNNTIFRSNLSTGTCGRDSAGCRTVFFRIVQEALNNIVKHSSAKQAHVEFVGRLPTFV